MIEFQFTHKFPNNNLIYHTIPTPILRLPQSTIQQLLHVTAYINLSINS